MASKAYLDVSHHFDVYSVLNVVTVDQSNAAIDL